MNIILNGKGFNIITMSEEKLQASLADLQRTHFTKCFEI